MRISIDLKKIFGGIFLVFVVLVLIVLIKMSVSKPKEEPLVFNDFNKTTNEVAEVKPKKNTPLGKGDLEWPAGDPKLSSRSSEAPEYDYNTVIKYSKEHPRLLPYAKFFMSDNKLTKDEYHAFLRVWDVLIYTPEKEQDAKVVRARMNKKFNKMVEGTK